MGIVIPIHRLKGIASPVTTLFKGDCFPCDPWLIEWEFLFPFNSCRRL